MKYLLAWFGTQWAVTALILLVVVIAGFVAKLDHRPRRWPWRRPCETKTYQEGE